jgi:LmbE family N-acetylglucosaminyl deacetylase
MVFLHAHPDDESILSGATLAKAATTGVRTVVVFGTRGDAGETKLDLGGESLGERRVREAEAACVELRVDRVEWLSHADSGMAGSDTTGNPVAFSNQPVDTVVAELQRLLAGENIVALVGYDANGTYGHPDHLQVHRVAHAAAPLLGADWIIEVTWNRDHFARLPGSDGSNDSTFASAEADLTHFVSGEQWAQAKFAALMNHRSQVPDDMDVDNPDLEGLTARFGIEWFIAKPIGSTTSLGPLHRVLEPLSKQVD